MACCTVRLSRCSVVLAAAFLAAGPTVAEGGGVALPELGFWPRFGGLRKVQLLDGEWKYGLVVDPSFDSLDQRFDPRDHKLTPNTTMVPSSMDVALPGYLGARGVAMYRTSFLQRGPVRLQFLACGFYCRVFVDGKEVGEHRAGGFVPWWLDVPAVSEDEHEVRQRELFVLADNRFNRTTAPMHTGGDFWCYGGLMRSVLLHELPPPKAGKAWVWRAHVLPVRELTAASRGLVDIRLLLTDKDFSGTVAATLAFDGGAPGATMQLKASGGVAVVFGARVPNPQLWSLNDPKMHTVTVTIDGASVTERFGLRVWEVDGPTGRLTLNGRIVKLHGWNHHTAWPDTGASPTNAQLDEDVVLLRQAGANYIRGSHYPQDQRWLDRLDEAGFAMWEETLGPGVKLANLQDWDYFMPHQLQQLDEMMEMSMNHPSIMAWAWFNEGPSHQEEACAAYAACADRAAAYDPTRFVTWASNAEWTDACLEHASLISFNAYPLKNGNMSDRDLPRKHWTYAANWARARYPTKPFTISETGAGGIYEWNNNATDAHWTTNFQTEVIAADVDVALSNPNVSGISIWHFFDFKANDRATAQCGPCEYLEGVSPPTCGYIDMGRCLTRPGGLNHKGVVDFWRRPKPAYAVVAKKFNASLAAQAASFTGSAQAVVLV